MLYSGGFSMHYYSVCQVFTNRVTCNVTMYILLLVISNNIM